MKWLVGGRLADGSPCCMVEFGGVGVIVGSVFIVQGIPQLLRSHVEKWVSVLRKIGVSLSGH